MSRYDTFGTDDSGTFGGNGAPNPRRTFIPPAPPAATQQPQPAPTQPAPTGQVYQTQQPAPPASDPQHTIQIPPVPAQPPGPPAPVQQQHHNPVPQQYGAPEAPSDASRWAVAMGAIFSLICCAAYGVGFIPAIAALVMGNMLKKQYGAAGRPVPRDMAAWKIVAILGIVLNIFGFIATLMFQGAMMTSGDM